MINANKIDLSFKQKGGSCVLSSYAIISNYFTKIPIESFFQDYCHHFGLTFQNYEHAEQLYAQHFDSEWRRLSCKGYEVILGLHNASNQPSFAESRKMFSCKFILDSEQIFDYIKSTLINKVSLINLTFQAQQERHSITAGYNGSSYIIRDTNQTQLYRINDLKQLGVGQLYDALLCVSN